MCGRLACGLQPRGICNSCCYKAPGTNLFTTPQWKDFYNLGKTYKPSYNVCPTEVAPVLLSGKHFKLESRVIAPMIFGVIPHWTKGVEHKYSTINCRIETIVTSKLYKNLLLKGQRCVVICNGFYEWQNQKSSSKKPYFIYFKQPDEVKIDDPKTWNLEFSPEKGFSGFRPLKLAALFEIDSTNQLEEATLSFTIITKNASSETSWLHNRMPAVLETDEQLDAWLNYEQVDANCALKLISFTNSLTWIPVSTLVNTPANKEISCIRQKKAPKEGSESKNSSADLLKAWLEKGEKKTNEQLGNVCKKLKKEEF